VPFRSWRLARTVASGQGIGMDVDRAPDVAVRPRAATDLQAGPCRLRVAGDDDGRTAAAIAAQVGGRPVEVAGGRPDLTLEIGSLPPGPRRLFGTGEYAASDEHFLLLRGAGKRAVEVALPFDALGHRPTLRCAPGSVPVPLLVPVLNVTALASGVVPMHAAAFDLDGLGVLVTGWSRSGKTETLLAFGDRGARYVGDEWVYLHPDGTLTGLEEPMRVWSWHLRQLDGRAPRLPLSTRASFAVLDRATEATAGRPLPGKVRRLRHLLSEQRNVRIPPQRLLPVTDRTALDVVILTESHDQAEITVEPIDPMDVARRMATMLPVERAPLLAAYQAFRYAFPGRRSDLLDSAEERERDLLPRALGGIPALLVRHPYPFSFAAMADTLAPRLDELRGR
jgi:hypothetical protein